MNRMNVFPGAIPLDTDVLNQARFGMISDGAILQTVLGTGTAFSGLGVSATPVPSLSVIVAPGFIIQQSVVDGTAYGSLPAASEPLMKMGIILDPTTFTFTPPGTPGQSQVFLIEAEMQEIDAIPIVLPYYNASNPTVPFLGSGNNGLTQNTQRQQVCYLQVKAGVAATTGTQVAPGADFGWTPLWLVTVAFGATALTTANVTPATGQPAIPYTLPQAGAELANFIAMGGSTLNASDPTQLVTALRTFAGGVTNAWSYRNAGGNITCPAWATALEWELVGGGGAGGSSQTSSSGCGGGGGAGGFAAGVNVVTPGQVIPLTVGVGGSVTISTTGTGGTGGTTSVGTFGTASGGAGGVGIAASVSPGVGGAGGAGATGNGINCVGGSGNDGGTVPQSTGGMGGASMFGPGGKALNTTPFGNGPAPGGFGGGGGGCYNNGWGCAGAPGLIRFRWRA